MNSAYKTVNGFGAGVYDPTIDAVQAESTLVDDVRRAFGDACSLVERLENLVDKYLGSVPTPSVGGPSNKASVDGVLNDLAGHAEYLRERVARGHSALGRLEARLG